MCRRVQGAKAYKVHTYTISTRIPRSALVSFSVIAPPHEFLYRNSYTDQETDVMLIWTGTHWL